MARLRSRARCSATRWRSRTWAGHFQSAICIEALDTSLSWARCICARFCNLTPLLQSCFITPICLCDWREEVLLIWMRSRGVIWVLPRTMNDALSRRFAERRSAEDPRTIRQRMTRFDLARFGGEPERLRCNAKQTRRLVQIKPWLVPIWRRPKDRDLMMRPERGGPLPCPAIAVA